MLRRRRKKRIGRRSSIVLEILGPRAAVARVKRERIYAFITRANTGSDLSLTWIICRQLVAGDLHCALLSKQSCKSGKSRKKGSRGWHSFRKFRATGSLGQIWEGNRSRPDCDPTGARLLIREKEGIFTEIHAFLPPRGMKKRVHLSLSLSLSSLIVELIYEVPSRIEKRRPTSVWPRDPPLEMEREIATPLRRLTNNLERERLAHPSSALAARLRCFQNVCDCLTEGACLVAPSPLPPPPPFHGFLRWNGFRYDSFLSKFSLPFVEDNFVG